MTGFKSSASAFFQRTTVPGLAVSADVTIETFLPRLALEFQWTEDVMFFGQYATGARNGNINSAATLALLETFVPRSSAGLESFDEDATATYELGVKARLLGGKATFNADIFYTEYEDLQVLVNTPPLGFAVILNAGEASTRGFEDEFAASLTEGLSVFAGASCTEAQLEDDLLSNQLTGASLASGTDLPNAPDWNINAGFDYEAPAFNGLRWYVNGNVSYTGDYTTSLNARAVTLGDYYVANGGVGLRGSNWSADLLATNLFDAAEIVAQNNFNGVVSDQGIELPLGVDFDETFLLQPRTLRLALRYDF